MGERIERWMSANGERREALVFDEERALEKRGRSGDPVGDERTVALAAQRRFFAEAVGASAEGLDREPPEFSRAVGEWCRKNQSRLEEIQLEALSAAPGVDGAVTEEMELLWERSPEAAPSGGGGDGLGEPQVSRGSA